MMAADTQQEEQKLDESVSEEAEQQLDEADKPKSVRPKYDSLGEIAIDQPSAAHHRAAAKKYRKTAATLVGMLTREDGHHVRNAITRNLRLAQKHDKWADEFGK